jgi:hypothetical protein
MLDEALIRSKVRSAQCVGSATGGRLNATAAAGGAACAWIEQGGGEGRIDGRHRAACGVTRRRCSLPLVPGANADRVRPGMAWSRLGMAWHGLAWLGRSRRSSRALRHRRRSTRQITPRRAASRPASPIRSARVFVLLGLKHSGLSLRCLGLAARARRRHLHPEVHVPVRRQPPLRQVQERAAPPLPGPLGWLLRHSPKRPLASRRPVGPSGRSRLAEGCRSKREIPLGDAAVGNASRWAICRRSRAVDADAAVTRRPRARVEALPRHGPDQRRPL